MRVSEEQMDSDQVDSKPIEIDGVKNKDILDKVREVLGR